MTMDIRGQIAIVGAGESDVGRTPDKSSLALHAEAARAALADAGIEKEEVDGVLTNDSYFDYHVRHAMAFAEYFGISSSATHIATLPLGSAAVSGLFVHEAASLILSGRCEVVLAVSADNFLSALGQAGAIGALAQNRDKEFEAPYEPILPACFALVARRYMHETGTKPEHLAAAAVSARAHASTNPRAQMRRPITVTDVIESPMIADPLHRLECSVISDGGAALVITSAERAARLKKPPVYVLGAANRHGSGKGRMHSMLAQTADLTHLGTSRTAPEAMAQAGVSHDDIDVLGCYDPFSIMPLLMLEAAGFCERGQAGPYVASGAIGPGGELPTNTHGGLLSYCHPGNPGGYFMVTEVVRQLRGEGGDNQVKDAELGMVLGYGGEFAIWPVTVLGNSK